MNSLLLKITDYKDIRQRQLYFFRLVMLLVTKCSIIIFNLACIENYRLQRQTVKILFYPIGHPTNCRRCFWSQNHNYWPNLTKINQVESIGMNLYQCASILYWKLQTTKTDSLKILYFFRLIIRPIIVNAFGHKMLNNARSFGSRVDENVGKS